MEGLIHEVNSKEQLLEYLQMHGVAVVVWNQTGGMACEHCKGMIRGEETSDLRMRDDEQTLRKRITEELVLMGFRQGQIGFNNIVEAICMIAQIKQGQQIRITSDIYPKVAARQCSTVRNVERTIRNAIESVWKRSNLQTLQEMYPYPCDNLNGRPTNAEFLINMAGKFRL